MAEGYEPQPFAIKYMDYTGTTTSSGALLVPEIAGTIMNYYLNTNNMSALVFRRAPGYFTVFENDLHAPIANTEVTIRIYYIERFATP